MSVAAAVGHWRAERQRIIFMHDSRHGVQAATVQTLFALRFQLSYGYFHIRISDPKFDIRISGYRLTTLVVMSVKNQLYS